MAEKQSPTRLNELLKKQTSLANNSRQTLAERPTFVTEITQRYGSFIQFSSRFSYARMADIVQNPVEVFRRDSPSLVRIDITYGRGSSASWLYDILQSMFVFLGVTNDKFSKEQVYVLSQTIAAQYKTLKVAEVLLFVSRFMAGKYGKFYGDTSYALAVTSAIGQFMIEREQNYADIEREKLSKSIEESKKGVVSFEEYKRMKEAKGESISDTLNNIYGK